MAQDYRYQPLQRTRDRSISQQRMKTGFGQILDSVKQSPYMQDVGGALAETFGMRIGPESAPPVAPPPMRNDPAREIAEANLRSAAAPPVRNGAAELDAIESAYNQDPDAWMRSVNHPTIQARDARSAELKSGGFQEFAPGQGYKGPELRGGGTVSMMTAPENVGRVTAASTMEDLERQVAEARMRTLASDPYADERAKAEFASQPGIQREIARARFAQGATQDLQRQKQQINDDFRASLDALYNDPSVPEDQREVIAQRMRDEADRELESLDPRVDMSKIGGIG